MFVLYDMSTIKMLLKTDDEGKLYQTVKNIHTVSPDKHLLITEKDAKKGDRTYIGIRCEEDFQLYQFMYHHKLCMMDALALKKDILDRQQERAKVKTKTLY